jgi:hypothetical protein
VVAIRRRDARGSDPARRRPSIGAHASAQASASEGDRTSRLYRAGFGAVVLAALGGIVGIVLATAASAALTQGMGVPYRVDAAINLASFAFAALIGVVFGYFPARRAARLDPIEALRHE